MPCTPRNSGGILSAFAISLFRGFSPRVISYTVLSLRSCNKLEIGA